MKRKVGNMENHGNLGGNFVYFIVEMCFFIFGGYCR